MQIIHYGHRVLMQWLISELINPIICSFMFFLRQFALPNWLPSLHFHYITSDDGIPPALGAKHDELWLWLPPATACMQFSETWLMLKGEIYCYAYTNAALRVSFCNWWRLTAKALCGVPSWPGVYSWGLRDHYWIPRETELPEAVEELEKTTFFGYSLLNKSSYFQRGQNVILCYRL